MRLIHTADLHLDTCFARAGMPPAYGNRRRQRIREVFADICERARQWPADALLIAGDLFEQERVTRDTVAFLRAQFQQLAPVPVFIAPGNHDPCTEASPYATERWPDNVTVFSKPAWSCRRVAGGRLCVHGFGFDGTQISSNPFGQLNIEADGAVHVAVGHGSERGHQPPDQRAYASFDASQASPAGLRYLALGHFHGMQDVSPPGADGLSSPYLWYSGAPEGQGFGHPGIHHHLEIDMDDAGTRVTPVASCKTVYSSHDIDCTPFETSQELIEALRALPRHEGLADIVRVTLRGFCVPALQGEFDSVYDVVAGDFEYLDLVDETRLAEDYGELATADSSLGLFIKQINDEIDDTTAPDRRRMLLRAREVGLAAYRGQQLEIRGVDRE